MYDLEILVPADTNIPQIEQRLKDFKKYGLWNIEETKIRLIFATSNNNKAEWLLEGWPETVKAELCQTPYSHVAQRTYYYYDSFINHESAKWFIRVDEDSITDIKSTVENLNLFYDPERDYHICGTHSNDVHDIDVKILTSLNCKHVFHPISIHEHEISITSQTAMKKILENPISKKYFNMRKHFADGHGDQGLALAARINKIYINPTFWLEHGPCLTRLSVFGGVLTHIHHTGRDTHPQIYNWLDTLSTDESEHKKFEGEYIYTKNKKTQEESIWIRLENKRISEKMSGETLGIYSVTKEGNLTVFFDDWGQYTDLIAFEEESDKLIYKNLALFKIN